MPAFDYVMPTVDHRICVRHLYANYRDIGGHRGIALKEKLWAAASAYTEGDFLRVMGELKRMKSDAHEYLAKIDPSTWSRAWFATDSKCDLLQNNICECFNSYILKARNKPILTMLEQIRKKLMRRYQAKRDGIQSLTGKLTPKIQNKLDAIRNESMDCVALYAGDDMFEVTGPDGRQFVVNMRRKSCGCRVWEMSGIPCVHACAAIRHSCKNAEDYVDEYFTVEMYKKAYEPVIYPMPSQEQWIPTQHDKLEPPVSRVAPGRPKKVRKRQVDERRDPKNPNRMRKFGARMKYSMCKGRGHNKRACPMRSTQASVVLPTPPPDSVSLLIFIILYFLLCTICILIVPHLI
jgi:hypothetical protein